MCYNYIKLCLNVNEPKVVFQLNRKQVPLAAYGVLLLCLAFSLGYLMGNGSGKTQIAVTAEPAKIVNEMASLQEETTAEKNGGLTPIPTREDPVNINTANQAELEQLPGIGPELAGRIIGYRMEHGEFVSKEQIMDVRGIGETRYREMESVITIGGAQ